MAKTAAELFNDMAKKAGWTAEQVTLALASDEGKELSNGYVRHAEYSSALDKARNLEQKATRADEWDAWHKQNAPIINRLQTDNATYQERLKQLGYTDDQAAAAAASATAAASGMTLQQVQQMLDQQSQNTSSLMRDMMLITAEHDNSRYGKLDVAALEATAREKQLTLKGAYDMLIAPKVKELETKELDDRIKRERDEAVRDYATRNNLPVNAAQAGTASAFNFTPRTGADAPKPPTDTELTAMWNEAANG